MLIAEEGEETGALCPQCGHRATWHHDRRGCGFHGFSDKGCPCGFSSDEVCAAREAAAEQRGAERVAAAVRSVADDWQRELESGAIRDEDARYCWALAVREVRAALKETP